MRTRRALAALVPLAVLSLTAACGSDDSEPDAAESSSAAAESTPTESEAATESETPSEESSPAEETPSEESTPAPASADLTQPGSELAVGDAATLPVNDGKGTLQITVTGIDKGTSADIADFKFTGKEKPSDYTPFYVQVTGKVVDGDLNYYDPAGDISGLIGEQPATQLIEFTTFKPCNGEEFDDTAKPGATLKSCTIALAPKGQTVDAAFFGDNGSDSKYSAFDSNQVTWK